MASVAFLAFIKLGVFKESSYLCTPKWSLGAIVHILEYK